MIQERSTITSDFPPLTHKSLLSLRFTANDMKNVISKLDPNKVHGHGMIGTVTIKLCDDSLYKPLELIFKSCLMEDPA